MKLKKKTLNLEDLFVMKLKALYDIEKELVKALPKMAKAASDEELAAGFEEHLAETENHVERLETIFGSIGVKPAKLKVEAIRGLIADAEWCVAEKPGDEALDALLVSTASSVEHHEISCYTTASKWARLLGYDEAAGILEETLSEEKATADRLEALAEEKIDDRAMAVMPDED